MTKIDVGVGDEFPVEDGKPREERPCETRFDGESREEWRAHREEWRRRWREQYRGGSGRFSRGYRHPARFIWPALALIGGIAVISAIISHLFYIMVGAALIAVLFAAHRNYHDGWHTPSNPETR